ncbi:MAG: alkaline phosphatase family protein [Glaciecola sp.]
MRELTNTPLPILLAGPMLRHVSKDCMTLWWISSVATQPSLSLVQADKPIIVNEYSHSVTPIGQHAFVHLLCVSQRDLFTPKETASYNLTWPEHGDLCSVAPALLYDDESHITFAIPYQLREVYHGSCRKPHHEQADALAQLDLVLGAKHTSDIAKPDILFFTGDQIYADDVAGPTLHVIQQTIAQLGLFSERFEDALIQNSADLPEHPYCFYQREALLPDVESNEDVASIFFKGKRKPIFTSVNAQNHLVSLSEIMAMYILTWSPVMWARCSLDKDDLESMWTTRYEDEKTHIKQFISTLPAVQRALAHVPTYMIFDDHDVTDDWNLTRGWEDAAYGHPFSKRMIGNALIGYLLCQGCGNQPAQLGELLQCLPQHFTQTGIIEQDVLIDTLLEWDRWHYHLDTQPPVRVLDTRTQRWRSESSMNKPSGLMDWESLVDFQRSIIGQDDVIVISAAPVYGVKFIEMIQRVFTWLGQALTVDAENWMAHKGTANVMLNIFRHIKTPPRFIILSGDVHYSFAYDIRLRFRRNSPQILQFTCSGLKNAFPTKLISKLDLLNRWFYGQRSPLNWLTKRRNMKISTRRPLGFEPAGLINHNGMGVLSLPDSAISDLKKVQCRVLTYSGQVIEFVDR